MRRRKREKKKKSVKNQTNQQKQLQVQHFVVNPQQKINAYFYSLSILLVHVDSCDSMNSQAITSDCDHEKTGEQMKTTCTGKLALKYG